MNTIDKDSNLKTLCNAGGKAILDTEILSEAASLLCYTDDELSEYFTDEEIAKVRAEKEEINAKRLNKYTIGSEQAADYRMVAEDESSYGGNL